MTKRVLLSELSKVFDPLGWLSPTTIKAKILCQELWKLKLGWDEELPTAVTEEWNRYQSELKLIEKIQIPRCITAPKALGFQLHGFCDASKNAYNAVVYLRTQLENDTSLVRLVAAKSKVAPIKQVSIPRLELCGAVILSKLLTNIKESLNINCELFGWTDSTVVLDWLADLPCRWETFVANRVAEIQGLIPAKDWRHVKSEENPADCASRGIPASELIEKSLWWSGPEWLKNSSFPIYRQAEVQEDGELEKKEKEFVGHACVEPSLVSAFSSLTTLNRVTAHCLRFVHNLKVKLREAQVRRGVVLEAEAEKRKSGELTCSEIQEGHLHWIKYVQQSEFAAELKSLRSGNAIPSTSKLCQLHPFVDLRGILRVGGRLQKAEIPEETKHQIIMPHNHPLTHFIIQEYHKINSHAGFTLLWCTLQRKYWFLRARDTIRHLVRKCVSCRKTRAETAHQLMGSLPTPRVRPARPFSNCGVDFAGPFTIRQFKGRGGKTWKCYFAIFVCMATKAVHLESVTELTTEAFIATFKRFSARRGVSRNMYSDNGTNFVGADRELQELLESAKHQSAVSHHHTDNGVDWHFNPPSAPHQGGLWEAGVKAVKSHLKRVVGKAVLTLEEFNTVLCQVEACLNSRPLCAMSSDPADYNVLTPGHFLIGEPLTAIPEPDLTDLKVSHLSRWQQTQQMVQHFWKRWYAEYLTSLQQRFKWMMKREDLRIGDLVIIKEDNIPPNKWKMGRVIIVHPTDDDCVRNATVKTEYGEMKRHVVKLCPILLNDE
jgi:hypothetical protein